SRVGRRGRPSASAGDGRAWAGRLAAGLRRLDARGTLRLPRRCSARGPGRFFLGRWRFALGALALRLLALRALLLGALLLGAQLLRALLLGERPRRTSAGERR